jgi:hypothetical protein
MRLSIRAPPGPPWHGKRDGMRSLSISAPERQIAYKKNQILRHAGRIACYIRAAGALSDRIFDKAILRSGMAKR